MKIQISPFMKLLSVLFLTMNQSVTNPNLGMCIKKSILCLYASHLMADTLIFRTQYKVGYHEGT